MTIILALCIPLTAFVVGFLVLKGVHLGLKWQYELKHEEKPVMNVTEVKDPFKTEEKKEADTVNILNEWLNGPQESR